MMDPMIIDSSDDAADSEADSEAVWEVEAEDNRGDQIWTQYPPEVAQELDRLHQTYRDDSSVSPIYFWKFSRKSKYNIDVSQFTQTRFEGGDPTGTVRPIRRQAANTPPSTVPDTMAMMGKALDAAGAQTLSQEDRAKLAKAAVTAINAAFPRDTSAAASTSPPPPPPAPPKASSEAMSEVKYQ